MNKPNMTGLLHKAQNALNENAPVILTSVGIFGMFGTTVMAVKATPRAIELIERKREEKKVDKLPVIEIVKATWKCYIPAAVTGIASTGCLLRANSISTRRNAALLTAYNLSKSALNEYKEKVVETIGEKKEKTIVDAIAKDKVEKNQTPNSEVIVTEKGTTLCYDALFGRFFISDMETIKRAENALNRIITAHMYASLNEFYAEIDLPPVDMGSELGWNFDDGEIKIEQSPVLAPDGRPCLAIHFNVLPSYGYSKLC